MGSMNVGKVSFGSTPVAGTTPGATQQASVKKADKSDVVVIGGKEFTKKQVAIGGAGILAAAAAIVTTAVSAHRGKNKLGAEAKFIDKVKEGFHTLINKEARAEYTQKFSKKAQQATGTAANKAATDEDIAPDLISDAAEAQITPNIPMQKTIDEFGPEGSRHAARIEEGYEEALPEIFAEGAKVNSREDVLAYGRSMGLV